jgi:hypothetical protein
MMPDMDSVLAGFLVLAGVASGCMGLVFLLFQVSALKAGSTWPRRRMMRSAASVALGVCLVAAGAWLFGP